METKLKPLRKVSTCVGDSSVTTSSMTVNKLFFLKLTEQVHCAKLVIIYEILYQVRIVLLI